MHLLLILFLQQVIYILYFPFPFCIKSQLWRWKHAKRPLRKRRLTTFQLMCRTRRWTSKALVGSFMSVTFSSMGRFVQCAWRCLCLEGSCGYVLERGKSNKCQKSKTSIGQNWLHEWSDVRLETFADGRAICSEYTDVDSKRGLRCQCSRLGSVCWYFVRWLLLEWSSWGSEKNLDSLVEELNMYGWKILRRACQWDRYCWKLWHGSY